MLQQFESRTTTVPSSGEIIMSLKTPSSALSLMFCEIRMFPHTPDSQLALKPGEASSSPELAFSIVFHRLRISASSTMPDRITLLTPIQAEATGSTVTDTEPQPSVIEPRSTWLPLFLSCNRLLLDRITPLKCKLKTPEN